MSFTHTGTRGQEDVQPSRLSQHRHMARITNPTSTSSAVQGKTTSAAAAAAAEPPPACVTHGGHVQRTSLGSGRIWLILLPFILITCLPSSTAAVALEAAAAAMPTIHTALQSDLALDLASFADSGVVHPPRLANEKGGYGRHDAESKSLAARTASPAKPWRSSTTSLPKPFEGSIGNNFTSPACANFIQTFILTPAYKACAPFSLLLQRSPVLLTETLDASCAANVTECTHYLNAVAKDLASPANCKDDLDLGNPTVVEARNGLIAYQPLYEATCLHHPATSSYCAVDAFTNTTSPTDSYIYYLPLAMSLPGGTTPTCGTCLQNTMQIYQKASANRAQPLFNTYASAAQQINVLCGPNFTNASIPAAVSSGAILSSRAGSGEGIGALMLFLVLVSWIF